MTVIGSTIRFFAGLVLSIEIVRQFIIGNELSWLATVLAILYILLAVWFFIEKDMRGLKSYIRFAVALIMAVDVLFNMALGKELSTLATGLSLVFLLMSVLFVLKKAGLIPGP